MSREHPNVETVLIFRDGVAVTVVVTGAVAGALSPAVTDTVTVTATGTVKRHNHCLLYTSPSPRDRG